MLNKYKDRMHFSKEHKCNILYLSIVNSADLQAIFKPGDRLLLINDRSYIDTFPLKNKRGEIFEGVSLHEPVHAFSNHCICIKGLRNIHTPHGGFSYSRFGLLINSRLHSTGGNV